MERGALDLLKRADHREIWSTLCAGGTRPGISNWVSDYGAADIYRTKEPEFFGAPWDAAARDRMIRQSPLSHAGAVSEVVGSLAEASEAVTSRRA